MKKPYLYFWQRQSIINDTAFGAALKVNIEMKRLARDFDISMIKILDKIVCLLNKKASN